MIRPRHRQPILLLPSLLTGFAAFVPAAPSAGIVTTDSAYVLVDGQRQFIIGSYDLPPGLSRDQFEAAGFNFLFESMLPFPQAWPSGLRRAFRLGSSLMVAPGHDPDWLAEAVAEYKSAPGLLAWHGPDEPAWQGDPLNPEWLANGHSLVDTYDDFFGHPRPVWINHACRGTEAHPDSFELLRPYLDSADIFSMDIYPVPESYEHSILPDKSISCVGEHTDILIDLLSDEQGRQLKPAWMVLQAFSWTDFFVTSEWLGTTRSVFDIGRVAHAAGGDVDGDGMQDLVFLYSAGDPPGGPARIKVCLSLGDHFPLPADWMEPAADSLSWEHVSGMDCGDASGDGLDDIGLLYHPGSGSGRILVLESDGLAFHLPADTTGALAFLRASNVAGYGMGDFDGDHLHEVVVAALTDTLGLSRQTLSVVRLAGAVPGSPEEWLEIPPGEISLKQVIELRTGDFTGDGLDDVCMLLEDADGSLRMSVASSLGSGFSRATSWWDTTTVEFPLENVYGLTSQDLNGDGRTDLLLFYSQEDHVLNPQWFVALISDGSLFYTERWGASAVGNYQFSRQQFPLGGDFNGDGFGDYAALFDRGFPPEDPYQVIRAALSYGERFGIPGPSLGETRFMAYDAVIHGATGIVWWGLWYTGGPYAVWRAVSEVAGELNTLRSFLVHDNSPRPVASDAPAIEIMLKEVGPYACLIAANRADSTLSATLSGASIGGHDSFDVLFEDRTVAPEGDALRDDFDAYAVHVYLAYAGSHSDPWPAAGKVSICPNPFGSSALFTLRTESAASIEVDIYDVRGRHVRRIVDRAAQAGLMSLEWDGRNSRGERLPAGVYLCRFRVGDTVFSRKVVCVR